MKNKIKIKYLNADLLLKSTKSFNELSKFLTSNGAFALHYGKENKKEWLGSFELEKECKKPKVTINSFLEILSKMDENSKKQWARCSKKEIDIGYECGEEPWAYNDEIPKSIIKKLSEFDIGIRITIYPENNKNP